MKNMRVLIAVIVAVVLAIGFLVLGSRKPTNALVHSTNGLPASVHAVHAAGLSNLYQLNNRVFSGSSPNSDAAFTSLKELGIKTIISVEGDKPNVEAARKFGLRYVHLPMGYSNVPVELANRMVKAAATLPGPVYVHCQYGWQRGPAGAAIVCKGLDGWTAQQAGAWLTLADTTSNYTGVFLSAANFQPPTPEVLNSLAADFPEEIEVTGLAHEMVEFNARYKTLRRFRLAGFQKLPEHPELTATNEARLFHEQFKALQSSPLLKDYDDNFRARLAETEAVALSLEQNFLATPPETNTVDLILRQLNQTCVNCHRDYRK